MNPTNASAAADGPEGAASNFIRDIIDEHLQTGKYQGRVHTRFPPEPNGYLHIGHAKAICINFGIARDYGGKCNLRFDDTNPAKEDVEFVESIQADIRWLGFQWDGLYYASDYFQELYDHALTLIRSGHAYIDSLSADEIKEYRGTATTPGRNSPYRDRPIAESLDLFERMKNGEFEEGQHVLRARIDMASPNFNLRDPAMYRVKKATHHRTGDRWCIYPMYDWAHGLSDSIEGITHSLCSLEFENHRPLYDWFLERLGVYRPQQIEFARLHLGYTVMSKRKLLRLVQDGHVSGWDDPRMPTLAGMRRRGYTPEAIRALCDRIGVAKYNSTIDFGVLEGCLRDDLNVRAQRRLAVLRPLKVVIENYPPDQVETVTLVNNPEDAAAGSRDVPFSRELWVERDDFMEQPPGKFFRLAPGREVRLRGAYYITCTGVDKNAAGEVTQLRCTYDPATRGGSSPDGRKVKGTLHWVSAAHAIQAEVRLYEQLFKVEQPDDVEEGRDFTDNLNPASLEVLTGCRLEPALAAAQPGERFQFERLGYFAIDPDSRPGAPVVNRIVTLRDSYRS